MAMEKIKYYFFLLFIGLLSWSCDPGEDPVDPLKPGDMELTEIAQGTDLEDQVWFSLVNGEVTTSNNKFIWDLEFSSVDDGGYISLNGSKYMLVAHTNSTDFDATYSSSDYTFGADHMSGLPDSLQIGDPASQLNQVILIDLGRETDGSDIGMVKFQITSASDGSVAFQWEMDNETKTSTVTLEQSEVVRYSFNTDEMITVFPASEDWELCFTQYTERFYEYDPVIDYLVNGVFINSNRVEAAYINDLEFDSISLSMVDDFEYSSKRDVIGYNWKAYNLDESVYTVYPKMIYVIKTSDGLYFKLHFIDYYNDQGERGFPLMEWQRL